MSNELEIPPRLTKQVLQTLMASRLITEVSGGELAFVPARPIETITCHDILDAMRAGSGRELELHDEPVQRQILGEFLRINEAEQKAAESVTVLAMAQRANQLLADSGQDALALTAGKPRKD